MNFTFFFTFCNIKYVLGTHTSKLELYWQILKFWKFSGGSPSSSQNPSKNVKRIFEIAPKANALTSYYSEQPTKNCSPTKLKRRKLNKEYAVIIEWLEVFTDEESDEEVQVPLVNKTARRRMQQMCTDT